jgi:chromosome segregation ATPase
VRTYEEELLLRYYESNQLAHLEAHYAARVTALTLELETSRANLDAVTEAKRAAEQEATRQRVRADHLERSLQQETRRAQGLEHRLAQRQVGRVEALGLLAGVGRYLRSAVEATPRHSLERKHGEDAVEKLARAERLIRKLGET